MKDLLNSILGAMSSVNRPQKKYIIIVLVTLRYVRHHYILVTNGLKILKSNAFSDQSTLLFLNIFFQSLVARLLRASDSIFTISPTNSSIHHKLCIL